MKKIVIIGGGVAGLSAGIYAQKSGFESVVYERNRISGGECTGWDREGFHIDNCIHWLMGTKEGTGLNKIWKEVGALGDIEIYQPEYLGTAEVEGTTVTLHNDLDKLREHLIEVSPDDCDEIEKLCKYIKAYSKFEMPIEKPVDLMNIFELFKYIFLMYKIGAVNNKLGKFTITDYVQKFKNPVIRVALNSIVPDNYSAYILPASLGPFVGGNSGIPKDGSRAFAQRMEEKYRSLGGRIIFGKEAREIIVGNGTAKGIILADGTMEYADYIVPTCDIHITFQKLLRGKYLDNKFQVRDNDEINYPLQWSVTLAFGVDADLSDYPEYYVFKTEEFKFENNKTNFISLRHYCSQESFAPEGKSIMTVMFNGADYDWWKEKRKNYEDYQAEKLKLAKEVICRIEERFFELRGKIKTLDVSTPITYERYCGAYKGSWMSYGPTPNAKYLIHNGKIKGLKNIYMAGQWLMPPGGLPTAVSTGKWAIQRICRKEKKQCQL